MSKKREVTFKSRDMLIDIILLGVACIVWKYAYELFGTCQLW